MTDAPGTLALARTAAGAVRSLNHATLGGQGLDHPADAYELIGELALAAGGLPQLLAQVGRWLAAALAAGQLGCDDGTDPAAASLSNKPAFRTARRGSWLFPGCRPRVRGVPGVSRREVARWVSCMEA